MHNPTMFNRYISGGLGLALTLAIIGSSGALRAQDRQLESVAVLDLEGRGISAIEASTLTDRMRTELVKTGAVIVVERGQMQTIMSEQDFQLTGCTSDECAVQIGQILGVTQMYTGSIGKIGSTYTVDVRVIDVETGTIFNSLSRDYRGEVDGLLREIERLSWDLVGLVHPDEILEGLSDEPQITIDDVTRRQATPEPATRAMGPPARQGKGKFGKRMFWGLVVIGGAGAAYVILTGAEDDNSASVSINVDITR